MIDVHNTFDPLKEIIIGDIDVNAIKLDSDKQQKRIEYIFKKTMANYHAQSLLQFELAARSAPKNCQKQIVASGFIWTADLVRLLKLHAI